MLIDVAQSISLRIEDPDTIVTVQPGKIQSWIVAGRSAEYKLSSVQRTPAPLPMIDSPRYGGSDTARSWSQWCVEPLTNQPAGLFMGIPMLCHRRDGSTFVRWHYNQAGNTPEEAYFDRNRFAVFEGPRNQNATTGYTTYQPDPDHNGWWGLDKMAGWLYHIHGDGDIWTCAGDETPVENGKIYFGERKRTGRFDKFWGLCTDFQLMPGNKRIVYVADFGNNRITKTLWSRSNGVTEADTFTDVEIPGACSLVIAPDGTKFVASRTLGKIIEVSPIGVQRDVITDCHDIQQVRFSSDFSLLWGARTSKNIYRVQGGTNQLVGNVAPASKAWFWFDIDTTGSVGPKDDILAVVSHTTPGTPMRMSLDGSYKSTAPNGGPLRIGRINVSGYGNAVIDSAQHYGWAMSIHPLTARFIVAGFGDIAHTVWRRVRGNENNAFNLTAYQRGRDQHKFGNDTFPSMINLHGPYGFAFTGLKNFDELAYMTDADLNAYIRGGMEGSLPARSFTDAQLRDYRYYIRINSIRALSEKIVY